MGHFDGDTAILCNNNIFERFSIETDQDYSKKGEEIKSVPF